MRSLSFALGIVAVSWTVGCSDNSEHVQKLRAALDEAKLSLADSVGVAEAETTGSIGVRAQLLVDVDPVFAVDAKASSSVKDMRVDIVTGKILSVQAASAPSEDCPGAVSLDAAIAAAEKEVGGEAVAIEPDDDGECNREVKVLASDTLWEVKVAPNGSIVESEEDDETTGDE